MNFNKLFLTVFLILNFLFNANIFAQETKIDSLKQVVASAKQDITKIKALNDLAIEYQAINLNTSLFYAKQSLDIAIQLNFNLGIANAYNSIGLVNEFQGNYSKALEYYKKALNIQQEIGNKEKIVEILVNIGLVYDIQSNYYKAIDYYKKALIINQDIGNKSELAKNQAIIGVVYYSQSNYTKALEYYKKALETFREIGNKQGIASNLWSIGKTYDDEKNYPKALVYYKEALNIQQEICNKEEIARNIEIIGSVYYNQSNYPKALDYYKKALIINQEIGNKSEIAINLVIIGVVYYTQSDYTKALNYFQQALIIQYEIGNKSDIADNLGSIGVIYNDQSNYSKAMEYYKKALIISQEIGDKLGIAINLGNVGGAYMNQSNYPKALEYYQKAIIIHQEIENQFGIALNLGNIGVVYMNQNNYPKAIEYYQKSLIINQEIGEKLGIALNLGNIGLVYNNDKNYPKALEYHQKALIINQEIENQPGIAINLGNIGLVFFNQSNYPKALEYYQKALIINQEIGNQIGIAMNLGNIGALYNNVKEYNEAINYYNKALKIDRKIGIVNIIPYKNLFISYWGLNNKNTAANNLDTVLNITNKNLLLNFSILSESAKQLYFSGVEEDYWKYNSFVLINIDSLSNMIEQVYNNTVKNKGLLLKSNTAMRNAIYASNDSTLMQNYDNWVVLKTQIAKKYSNGGDATILEHKADSLEGNLVKNSNEFSDFKKVQNIDWKQVQARLQENEVAIEFTHFPLLNPDSSIIDYTNQIQYIALVITKNSKQPEMIPLFEEKQLEKIIGKFGGNNYSYINSIYGKNNEVNTELYNLIWAPIDNYLDNINVTSSHADTKQKIYLSPSGLLHKISFSAIAKKQDVYLCDAYDIEVKSTTGKITEQNNGVYQRHTITTATLFGGINYNTDSTKQKVWNYLEGTKTETQEIDKILKNGKVKVNYFTNTSATEDEFKLMASNSNILHIATHGFFYPDPNEVQEETEKKVEYGDVVFRGGNCGFGVNSFVESYNPLMRSGLVFAGANDVWSKQVKNDSIDDGVLTAQEVANIDMRKTELVVMSACETGLGDIKGSEGVYGLQRAFKMAGVKYEIMSLWQVPDKETEEFMTTFYKKLIKQKDIKKAFADTQKEMRNKYDPYFWAAFVLIE